MELFNKIISAVKKAFNFSDVAKDETAAYSMNEIIDGVVGAVVGFLLIGYLGPIGLQAMVNATGFAAGGTLATIFTTVLPILGAIVFFLIVVNYLKRR